MGTAGSTFAGAIYPERNEPREGALDRILTWTQYVTGGGETGRNRLRRIIATTNSFSDVVSSLSDRELHARATGLRARLRLSGYAECSLAGEVFALVREAAVRTVKLRHFDEQLVGGWALLNGMIAEMETGEGKTLTATLAAATAALSGHAVHVITVNDYLAQRDAEGMRPIYESLGVSVGCVTGGMTPAARRAAYGHDVTYCSNKEVAFDYLRDRTVLGGRPRPIAQKLATLSGNETGRRLLLRGLQFAIVDEADSVLIDEARTPLILSADADYSREEALHRQALDLATQLTEGDYAVREERMELTPVGVQRLEKLAAGLGGIWTGPRRREQLVRQALTALHLFERDKHYLVHEGKVVIVDEYTGRLMPDRSWEQGLHQLIEIKENCEVTGRRDTLARISYQRFFRRYLHLSGMTGTASEVAREVWAVYRLRVAKVPTHKPVCRVRYPDRVYGRVAEKWGAVVASIERHRRSGRPVLVGTRSVAASEHLASLLDAAHVPYRLLNARQDRDEAEIVARAGDPACVTVATNMAGRGTDITLAPGVSELGGLHVIATELHDSARIDRQLFGRCARQGDPGSAEAILAIEDDLVQSHFSLGAGQLRHVSRVPAGLGKLAFRVAQWRAESGHSRARRDLLDLDDYLGDVLAFAGRGE